MGERATKDVAAARRHIIRRPRLTRLLDECEARIILLVAPAGYGKTTLAREWLSGSGRRAEWYRAQPSANDVAALAAGMQRCAAAIVPDAGAALRDRLAVTSSASAEARMLAELLAADLADWPADTWLVLDDYHVFSGASACEEFAGHLTEEAPIRVLITSRIRPKWATARRILYGEIYEIGRSLLAMDHSEALAVLGSRDEARLPGLVALAEGWPAVISLAALVPSLQPPEATLPSALHEFFADELYRSLSKDSQRGLEAVALAPRITEQVAEALVGAHAIAVLEEGVAAGFLTIAGDGAYELHPLLQRFLERKSRERGTEAVRKIERLVERLLELNEWDDALAVTRNPAADHLVPTVLRTCLDPLLRTGRLDTISATVAEARANGSTDPVLHLAEAEAAFRQGEHRRAQALGEAAIAALDEHDALRSRVLYRTGLAAYFADRTAAALAYGIQAERSASTKSDAANALWLQFVASTELEDEATAGILANFAAQASAEPTDVVRVATARLVLDGRLGGVPDALISSEDAYWVAPLVPDPMIRTSFYNVLARALTHDGEYARALGVCETGLEDAARTRLDFAIPHLYTAKANAHLGLRQMSSAVNSARQARRLAADPHTKTNAALAQARISIAQHNFSRAREILREHQGTPADAATVSELFAYEALAAACDRQTDEAVELATKARSRSTTIEPSSIAALALAIALRDEHAFERAAELALESVVERGHVDFLSLAMRACARLRTYVRDSNHQNVPRVRRALELTDESTPAEGAIATLTPREREVLELIALGLSNREIAGRLYITEVTTKVHVRHIFDKLGVRSRTQAAARLASDRVATPLD